MAIPAIDFMLIAAPPVAGIVAVVALRIAVADASRREQARIRRILKSFDAS